MINTQARRELLQQAPKGGSSQSIEQSEIDEREHIAFSPYWVITLTIPKWDDTTAAEGLIMPHYWLWLRAMNVRTAIRAGLTKPKRYQRAWKHSYFSYVGVADRTEAAVHIHLAAAENMNRTDALEIWKWKAEVEPIYGNWLPYMYNHHPYGKIIGPWVKN